MFAVTNGTMALSTAVSGGITSGQVTGNGTGSVTVTAPLAAINATLADANGLTYTPMTGFNGSDSLGITAGDTLANSSTANVSIAVGLTLTLPTAQVAQANGTLAIGGVSISDPALTTEDTVTLTFGVTGGTVNLSTTVSSGVTSGQVTGNGTGTVTVTAPLAAVNATLAATNGLTYTPTTGFSGSDTLAVSAVDSLESSNSGSVPLTVVGPLAITVPAAQEFKVNGTHTISGVFLADPSLPTSDNVTLTLAVTNGTVALSPSVIGGVTGAQITGNGSNSVTITAPLAAINTTLADNSGLSYSPTNGFTGADALALFGPRRGGKYQLERHTLGDFWADDDHRARGSTDGDDKWNAVDQRSLACRSEPPIDRQRDGHFCRESRHSRSIDDCQRGDYRYSSYWKRHGKRNDHRPLGCHQRHARGREWARLFSDDRLQGTR